MKYLKIYLCIVLTLLVSSAFINAQTNPQDSAALVAIYRHAHGDSWTNNTNWLKGPVDTWYGVTVFSQRVVGLDLSSNTLSGILHDSVGLLTALNTLILNNNQLSGVLPDALGQLSNLISPNIRNNRFSGSLPPALGNLTLLADLDVSRNQLTGAVPAELTGLTQLKDLSVIHNRLDDLPDFSFLIHLNNLSAPNNRFTFEDIDPNIGGPNNSFVYSPQDSIYAALDTTVKESDTYVFSAATGGLNNRYQGYKNGQIISGATQSRLQIANIQLSDSGVYSCQVTNTVATALTLHRRPVTVSVSGIPPAPPLGLTVQAVAADKINLSWQAPSGVVLSYRIHRALLPSGTFIQTDAVPGIANGYLESNRQSRTVYYYQVVAVGNFGHSGPSNTAYDTTHSTAPVVAQDMPDTAFTENFGKVFYRNLNEIFTEPDNPLLSFQAQSVITVIRNPVPSVSAFKIIYCDVDPMEQYIREHNQSTPARFALRQNYPNTFNPGTHLRFELPVDAKVTGTIYNARGQEIITLMHQKYFAVGVHELFWNGKARNNRPVAPGIYIYRFNVQAATGKVWNPKVKMTLLK